MDSVQELLDWATSHGVKLNGILPKRIPGRGIGVLATRDIQADEIVLDVPTSCVRSLSTVPKLRLRKLGGNISVHGILAADIALDKSTKYSPWNAICPLPEDLATVPLVWPAELQALLPLRGRELLAKHQVKFSRDWGHVAATFPELNGAKGAREREGRDRYRYAWLLVNTRTFYYLNAAIKRRRGATKDDHLALQPVADLFNHGDEGGCHVAFGSDGFAFRATAPYKKGDEVKICYGRHGGDFLLVEYGFVMEENCWDETLLDDVVLERLDEKQRERLQDKGFLGGYVLDRETVCHRTQVALRLLCCEKVGEWMRFVDGSDGGEASQGVVDKLLLELLREYRMRVDDTIEKISGLEVGEQLQKDILTERWRQICRLLNTRIASLEQEQRT
ncbi:SET domain-containing protein [Xylariaceae sp. AK1471]|nr:SET domain-containing protein [Xylariaceae sp. AK1471]